MVALLLTARKQADAGGTPVDLALHAEVCSVVDGRSCICDTL